MTASTDSSPITSPPRRPTPLPNVASPEPCVVGTGVVVCPVVGVGVGLGVGDDPPVVGGAFFFLPKNVCTAALPHP